MTENEIIKSQAAEIERLKKENDHRKNIITLLEQDIADRDDMLQRKVEDVYADFMNDYKIMKDELDALYDKGVEQRKEIDRLRAALKKYGDTLKERVKGIYLDENVLAEIIDELV